MFVSAASCEASMSISCTVAMLVSEAQYKKRKFNVEIILPI